MPWPLYPLGKSLSYPLHRRLDGPPWEASRHSASQETFCLHVWRPPSPSPTWGSVMLWWQGIHISWSLREKSMLTRLPCCMCPIQFLNKLTAFYEIYHVTPLGGTPNAPLFNLLQAVIITSQTHECMGWKWHFIPLHLECWNYVW